MKNMPPTAIPVWTDFSTCNQTVAFRARLRLDSVPKMPELLIAADTDFIVWCNGIEAGRGQYPDYPHVKSFTRISLTGLLKKGGNVLAVLAYHLGKNGFSTGLDGIPYVAAALTDGERILSFSSPNWLCAGETGWQNGLDVWRSPQLGYTTIFDSRVLPGWTLPDYDDSTWRKAIPVQLDATWRERPIPPCILGDFVPGTLVKSGTFRREKEEATTALTMQKDHYFFTSGMPDDAKNDDGVFAIFDLGAESVGFLHFVMDAPNDAVVDYAHGEHLEDGIVRMYVGERNFADRYIAHAGTNRHELFFHRCGLRYLQINISNLNGASVKIHAVGIHPWDYPRPKPADFVSDDLRAPVFRNTARRTLELCMHEHFEDCPWREQAKYCYDSRNQALYGYYLWGNYDFVRSSFQLIADSWEVFGKELHLMTLCAPSTMDISIPMFSFTWVSAARELYLYSGDRTLFDDNRAMVCDILDDTCSRQDSHTGLYHTGTDSRRWNFYEWSPGLEGTFYRGCPADEYHAVYNLYLIEMFDNSAALFGGEIGRLYSERADKLRKAVHQAFWNPEKKAYASRKNADGFLPDYHDHTQYLAFRNHVIPDEKTAADVLQTLESRKLHYATLSAMPYLIDAMMPVSAEARSYAAALLRKTYGSMMERGATTFWETQEGASAFKNAGSLCHGWSSLPVYYQGAEILGIRPLEPGFLRFRIRPYADAWTHFAEGTVPSPHGDIQVAWQKREDGLHLRIHAPSGTDFTVESYPECPVVQIQKF